MSDYRKGCYATKDLLKRGWTKALIRKLLGEPDFIQPLGRYACANLYIPLRVSAWEEKPEFKSKKKQETNATN
jgi:hypothetical protein